jgi:hypothetical protein
MGPDLCFQRLDLGVQGADDRHRGLHGRRVGVHDHARLGQIVGAQPRLELGGLVCYPMAAGALERRHELAGLKAGCAGRVRRGGQQLQRVRGGQVVKCL